MRYADVIMGCICDYAGQVRGKGFLYADLASRVEKGIDLAPSNLMINAFGQIAATPWGAQGDLLIKPDLETETHVVRDGELPDERFVLGSLTTLDGAPWSCCPRGWLQRGLSLLEDEFGLRLYSAFEHEFHYSGATPRLGDAYALDSMRLQGGFAEAVMQALIDNGIEPEMVMPEYGPQQFEVTNAPAFGVKAADRAVRLREIVRSIARAHGHKATFSPVMGVGAVGNGVHIHYSLSDRDGAPMTHDPRGPGELSPLAGRFTAGILAAMPSLVALTAPSMVSYERLQPNRWSAAFNNLADKNREAGVRICPVSGGDVARAFNLEYRAADATASPYLALGALVWAGLDGLRRELAPPHPCETPPDRMTETERARLNLRRLPATLAEALDTLEEDAALRSWMGGEFHQAYLIHKRGELDSLRDLTQEEQVRRYAEAY